MKDCELNYWADGIGLMTVMPRATCKIRYLILPKLQLGVSGDSENLLTVSTVYIGTLESVGNR